MSFNNFSFEGTAKRIEDLDITLFGHRIAVGEDEVHAFMDVEAASSGFDDQGRPKMLFEPHVFYRELGPDEKRDRAVAEGLAYKDWVPGKYPRDSYPRLKSAMKIDETAALKSASWGLGQILGTNHAEAGYRTVQDMVRAFMEDEDEHLEAMIRFITNAGIADALRNHQWDVVARVYNGPSYRRHGYHTKLAAAYRKWAKIKDTEWEPARKDNVPMNGDELKKIQTQLRDLGYSEVGKPDGKWGTRTRSGILAFRADNNLPIYVGIDDEFRAALLSAKPRDIAPERKEATVDDLRKDNSRSVKTADKAQGGAAVLGILGTATAGLSAVEELSGNLSLIEGLANQIEPLKDALLSLGPWCGAALGAYILYQMYLNKQARLEDHQSGKNAGSQS